MHNDDKRVVKHNSTIKLNKSILALLEKKGLIFYDYKIDDKGDVHHVCELTPVGLGHLLSFYTTNETLDKFKIIDARMLKELANPQSTYTNYEAIIRLIPTTQGYSKRGDNAIANTAEFMIAYLGGESMKTTMVVKSIANMSSLSNGYFKNGINITAKSLLAPFSLGSNWELVLRFTKDELTCAHTLFLSTNDK